MKNYVHTLLIACAAMLCGITSLHAQKAPSYDGTTSYVVEFNNSKLYLTSVGAGKNLQTQNGTLETATDLQLWSFVGTASKFQLKNKAGEYISYSTTASRLQASTSEDANGFTLVSGGTTWQLKWLGAPDGKAFMKKHSFVK